MKKQTEQLHPACKKAFGSFERMIIIQKDQMEQLLELINLNQKTINKLFKIVKRDHQALAKLTDQVTKLIAN